MPVIYSRILSSPGVYRPYPHSQQLIITKVLKYKYIERLKEQHDHLDLKIADIWGASLVAQWLRVPLPVQETQVRCLVQEDPTCLRAAKPELHNHSACALEPGSRNY